MKFLQRHRSDDPAAESTEGFASRLSKVRDLVTSRPKDSVTFVRQFPGAQPRPRFDPPAMENPTPDETEAVASTGWSPEMQDAVHGHNSTHRARNHGPEEYAMAKPVFSGFMLAVGVGLALLCLWVLTNVGALAGWIVGSLLIALGLDPLVKRLEKWGMPRPAGVLTVVLTSALLVVGLLWMVIPKIANQTVQLVNGFPDMFNSFLNSGFFLALDNQFHIRSMVDHEVQDGFAKITGDSNIVSGFLNNLVNAGSTIANIITGTIVVLILSMYFLSSLPMMKAWFVRLTPATKRARVASVTEKITETVGNYVMGQAIVAFLNATVAFIVMMIVGAPFPQLLTLFVLILAFIPLVGGVTAGILVSLLCLMTSWQAALIYAICYFIYLQIEAYFVSPRIMSKAVAVPGGIAIIAVAAGGALWGVLGALIAIPVAASLLILVREVLVPRQDRH
ncbi:AI-2E family transporter [Rothia sp. LK2588]|uniref:AI-2E family transporter n=1 Tax=Rothia sp. LK2588 TaxID=3114369 RepID=UPI0034CDAF2A